MKKKQQTFTVEEANRTLPLVRHVVRDVVASYNELGDLSAEAREQKDAEDGDERAAERRRRMDELSERIEEFARELAEIGCEMKDPEHGLVDFLTEIDDRKVYLCWKLGEDRVEFWHELTGGWMNRKPLPVTV